ncbi:MAG: LacI family DNA-binding transcriptional regulator [Opitutaceae bacterium]|nr:LacI family DNA-binding transcriptional regulator [Opitutaceae bacterium]
MATPASRLSPVQRRTTTRDIAAEAGVHPATVSRALRNHPSIPEETRKRVQSIAEKLGYKPDPMLASLMAYRQATQPTHYNATLAWVTNHPDREGWKNQLVARDYFQGAERRATALGYKIETFWLREPGMTAARASTILATRAIQGLLLAPQPDYQGRADLDWDRFSSVALGFSLITPALHIIANHQFSSMLLAVDHLRALGYRRVGLVLADFNDERTHHNWTGAFLGRQLTWPESERLPCLRLPALEADAFHAWRETHRPDAILTPNFDVVLGWLAQRGLTVPDDIGLCAVPTYDSGHFYAGVQENSLLIGEAAVEFLIGMLHRNERGVPPVPHRLLIESTWLPGRTLRNPVAAPPLAATSAA